jgi:hypothetical protein
VAGKFLDSYVEMTKKWYFKDVTSWREARSSDQRVLKTSEKEPEIINSKFTLLPQDLILKFLDN